MLTITTTTDILFQVHKNHVSLPLPAAVTMTLTGFNGSTVETLADVRELANCYLLTVPALAELATLGLNVSLTLSDDQGELYATAVQLRFNESAQH